MTTPENSFGFLLHDTARLIGQRFEERTRPELGLTRAQCKVLATLTRNEGVNQTTLADLLDIEPMTLVRILDRMEEAGWIERRPDPADRRARLLHTTPRAAPLYEKIQAIANVVSAEALAGLSAEDAAQMMRYLKTVRSSLACKPAGSDIPRTKQAATGGAR